MNTLQRFAAIFVTGFLFCTLSLNSSMAQNSAKSSENIRTQIIIRSMTARESQNFDKQLKIKNQEKSIGQKALSSAPNAFASSVDTTLKLAKKNTPDLVKQVDKVVREGVKSPSIKWIVKKTDGKTLDRLSTGSGVLGSAVEGDVVGVGEGLLNHAGSGYSAAAGGKTGAFLGSMIAPGPGTVIGGFVGAFAGALTYNVVVAPQVEKAGDYASDKITSGEAQIENKRLEIKRDIKKNFDTVYPNGYTGSGMIDPWTGMIEDLRPDVLYQKAEKIREPERKKQADQKKFNEKVDQEIKKITKKKEWQFTPEKTKPEKKTAFKVKKTVPNVKNKSLKDAFDILKNAGFILSSPEGGDPAPSKKLVGHVQMQLPAGGQPSYQDKPVVLILYSDVEIPDVFGMTAIKALEKLKKAGFSMKTAECDPPPTKDWSLRAKRQDPAAYVPGNGYDTVTVTFYCEYQNPVTPKITTFELSKAQGVLKEMGLSLNPDTQWGDPASRRDQVGKILKQQPSEGEPIEPGGQVTAWIYYTVVPKVLTMSKKDAESAMKAAWFVPNSVEGESVKNKDKWGTIYSQTLQPKKKYGEIDKEVTLKFYKKPKKKNMGHPIVTHWEGKNKKNKIKIIVYWDITSIDNNGKIKGTITNPKQVVQLHNGKGDTMKMSKQQVSFHGSLKGNKITIFYEVPGAKTMLQGVWDVESMTMEGMSMVSTKLNKKWHKNGVYFYLKKK